VKTHKDPPALTKAEFARKYKISVSTVDRRIAAGKLRVIRSGRIVRILPEDEQAMFEAGSQR
jgi:excisionase family DNA binding protein